MERLAVPTSFLVLKYADCAFATDSAAIIRLVSAEDDGREGDVIDLARFFPNLPRRTEGAWLLHIDTGKRTVRLRASADIELLEFAPSEVFATAPGNREGTPSWVRGVVRLTSLPDLPAPFAMWIDVLGLVNAANAEAQPAV